MSVRPRGVTASRSPARPHSAPRCRSRRGLRRRARAGRSRDQFLWIAAAEGKGPSHQGLRDDFLGSDGLGALRRPDRLGLRGRTQLLQVAWRSGSEWVRTFLFLGNQLPRTLRSGTVSPQEASPTPDWNAACSSLIRSSPTTKRSHRLCSVLVPIRSTVAMWGWPPPVGIRGCVRGGSG